VYIKVKSLLFSDLAAHPRHFVFLLSYLIILEIVTNSFLAPFKLPHNFRWKVDSLLQETLIHSLTHCLLRY